ncbi:undecaprenyl-diphosphatase UppP [Patescibacteria group bacterium]
MLEIFQSIVLGIVQGLGEFLPVSSTAHLILVPYFTGWEDPGLAFDVALHAGTLVAVLAYFWRDWMEILGLSQEKTGNYNSKIVWLIVIATIPGALAGYFLEKQAETIFRSPLVIAFTLSFVGLLLYLADKYIRHRKNINEISLVDTIIIGLTQAVAIIPGVSRSGVTITAGLALGLNRVSAARFSFLLSTPIIFGAMLNQLPNLMREGIDIQIIIGITVSAISGYLAIKYLLKLIEKVSYRIFFWYRLVLAILIVLFVWI